MQRTGLGSYGSSQVVINVQRQVEIAKDFTAPAMKHKRAGAIRFDDLPNMRREDHRAVGSLFEEFFVRPALEALIAGSNYLVDQVAIKING
jgi:hypothetical protein